MTIETKDIPAALVDIHTKLVEKLGGQPYLQPQMRVSQSGDWVISIYKYTHGGGSERIASDNPTDTIKQALDFIAGMVSKEEQRVAKVIDDGHDLNLPDSVMAPLRASSQAMTENLLTVVES